MNNKNIEQVKDLQDALNSAVITVLNPTHHLKGNFIYDDVDFEVRYDDHINVIRITLSNSDGHIDKSFFSGVVSMVSNIKITNCHIIRFERAVLNCDMIFGGVEVNYAVELPIETTLDCVISDYRGV